MKTLFATVVDGIENNNTVNNAKWSDWQDAYHAIEIYGEDFEGKTEEEEMSFTVDCLDEIIKENGKNRDKIVQIFNQKVWYPHLDVQNCHCDLM